MTSEGRGAKWPRVETEKQVMHYRIADHHQVQHLAGGDIGTRRRLARQVGDRLANGAGEGFLPIGVHLNIGNPANHILTETDLRVDHAGGRLHPAGRQVHQMGRQGGGADVDGQTERLGAQSRPNRDHPPAVAQRHRHLAIVGGEGALQDGQHMAVGGEAIGQFGVGPLAREGALEALEIAARGGQIGRRHGDEI